jgi:hypothetical protein
MNKADVEELASLYGKRVDLQKCKEHALQHNFWVGVATDAFGGTGTRSSVLNAIGGTGEFVALMKRSVCEHIEAKQQAIDAQIVKLGGEP